MQTTQDFAGSTDMWSTSAGGHLMKVVNLTCFTVLDEITSWRSGLQFGVLVSFKRCLYDFTYLTVFAFHFLQI